MATNNRERVLDFLSNQESPVSVSDIRTGTGVSQPGGYLRDLAAEGAVVRIGEEQSRRNVFWAAADSGAQAAEKLVKRAPKRKRKSSSELEERRVLRRLEKEGRLVLTKDELREQAAAMARQMVESGDMDPAPIFEVSIYQDGIRMSFDSFGNILDIVRN